MRNPGRIFTLSRFSIYFEMVAQTGSIRQAASALNVSPSAVNRQILAVEEDIQTPLFHRHSSGLSLTTAGELLLAAIISGKRDFEQFQSRLDGLSGLHGGVVEIAAIEAVSDRLIPDILSDVTKRHPRVEFRLQTLDFKAIWQAVSRNDVDFGISLAGKSSRQVRIVSTLQAAIGFVVRPDHPLAQREDARLNHATGSKLILPDSTLAVGAAIQDGLAQHNLNLNPTFTSNRIASIKALIRSGLGVGMLTRMDVMNEVKAGELCFVPITESGIRPLGFSLFYNTQRRLSAAAQTTLDLITESFNALAEQSGTTPP